MTGHLLINPYKYLIPQISSCLILYWIYLYCNYTTSTKKITRNILILSIIEFLSCILIFGLYITIFINFLLFTYFAYTNNLCDLIQSFHKKFLGSLYVLSFVILALEISFCNYLLSIYPSIPFHVVFDILFWQVNSNLTLLFL